MSNIQLIIEERAANIGNFLVGRLLPFREKRMVGPFIFLDHMGPARMDEHQSFDVAPHPHIGLSTLTYLFEGSILHKDSLGTEMEIRPGAVNWMSAGKGIVHSERTPPHLRNSPKILHGLQIWVALPKELEEMNPSFTHIDEKDIPHWEQDGISFKLIAGEALGKKSAVPVHSKLYFLELKSSAKNKVSIGHSLFGESALYILDGSITCEGNSFHSKQILVAKNSTLCEFEMDANTTVCIFGGEPFAEERFIDWNFVATNKELIEQAKQKWLAQQFEKVPGEIDFVPLPTPRKK
jgi:redox-sensitive bicupin YhaK (pirin superfamily)